VKFLLLSSRDESSWFSTGLVVEAADAEQAIEDLDPKQSRRFPYLKAFPLVDVDFLHPDESLISPLVY
jgi:hypothetical protein